MSAVTYVTRDGDTADSIAFARYGYTNGSTEAVLAANKGLADHVILPTGITVTLPDLSTPPAQTTVQLWQ